MSKGFVIVPIEKLGEYANDMVNQPEIIITERELVSMYASTVIEINKGDNGPKSLNVKLYNCLAPYAQKELDDITKRNLK